MIADNNRTVHAFNTQSIAEAGRNAIFYRTWRPESGWSGAVDIEVRPDTSLINIQGAYIDASGFLHLVFYYGTQQGGEVFYSTSPISSASDARSWSDPVAIGERAGPLPCGYLLGNGDDELVLIYCGRHFGVGLYSIRSEDRGQSWSAPSVVQLVYEPDQWPTAIRAVLDPQNNLHAVWTIVSERGVGDEVYYSRYTSERREWREPTLLAGREGDDYSAHWPSITWHEEQLLVIYQDSFPATRFMRQSLDGGDSWTEPVRPFPHSGEYEQAVLLHDSDGDLHMVLGNRTSQPEIHGMWYSTWTGVRWTELQPIVSGPLTSEFDPSAPEAVIVQGNVLLVAWWNNVPRAEVAWYSFTQLDASETPLIPAPTPELTIEDTPMPTATAIATPEPTPVPLPNEFDETRPPTPDASTPGLPIVMGIAPVVLLVVIALILSTRRLHGRL